MDWFGSRKDLCQTAGRTDRLADAFESCANPATCVVEGR
jgi:hypothetical protein